MRRVGECGREGVMSVPHHIPERTAQDGPGVIKRWPEAIQKRLM